MTTMSEPRIEPEGARTPVLPTRVAKTKNRGRRKEAWTAYVLLAPSLLFFLVFLLLPSIFAVVLSLSSWGGFDLSTIEFVGLENVARILSPDSTFVVPILINTLVFAFGSVTIAVIASVAIAQFIERISLQGFWRTLYFLPLVTTVVAVGNVWKYLYRPSGFINGALNFLGFKSIPFLTDPGTALPAVIVVAAWGSIGSAILILTAGLKSIPDPYYEAAEIDGANSWQQFWKITLPLLRPTLLFVLITQVIGGLQSFALINVMTGNGGPANSTNVAALEMYQQAFAFGQWGTASAMAMVLFVIIFVITLIELWFFRTKGEDTE